MSLIALKMRFNSITIVGRPLKNVDKPPVQVYLTSMGINIEALSVCYTFSSNSRLDNAQDLPSTG